MVDLNHDGPADVIVGFPSRIVLELNRSPIGLFRGRADGRFDPPVINYVLGGNIGGPGRNADFTGDGFRDIVLTSSTNAFPGHLADYSWQLFTSSGGSDFRIVPSSAFQGLRGQPAIDAVADLDGDTVMDLVVHAASSTDLGQNYVVVFFGGIGGGFTGSRLANTEAVTAVTVSDVNGDGKLDLLCQKNYNDANTTLFYGDGARQFSTTAP